MIKNTASQKVGAQMIAASDGSAFTSSVTVAVTLDAGTQATGSVGSGACTHEGNGYHTYAPAQAETNGDLAAFTFTGTGAVPQTVQIYTRAATPDVNVASLSSGALTATAIAADAFTAAKFASDVTTELQTGLATATNLAAAKTVVDAIKTVTDALPNAGALTSIATASALSTAQTAITAIKAKTDNLPSDPADASDIAGAFSTVNGTLATIAGYVDTEVAAIKVKTDLIPASPAAVGDIPSAATIADAVWDEAQSGHVTAATFGAYLDASVSGVSTGGVSAGDIADAVLDELLSGHTTTGSLGKAISDIESAGGGSGLDAAGVRSALGMASANMDTQLANISGDVDGLGTLLAAADADIEDIKAVTDLLPNAGALTSLATAAAVSTLTGYVDTEVGAIKSQTDKLTFNVRNEVAANTESINNTVLTGDGSGTPWGPA